MGAIEILTWLSLLLLLGIVLTYFARRLKVSNVLILILAGLIISLFSFQGKPIISFSPDFLTAVGIIALIMIVFDSTSRIHLKTVSKESVVATKVTLLFIVIELVVISIATKYILNFTWSLSIVFASLMVGTDPSSVIALLQHLKHRAVTFLEIESILNTPFTVILPFIVLEISKTIHPQTIVSQFVEQLFPFLQQIITGVGAGVVVALIVFKIMEKQYSEILSPVTLITSALLTYILADTLGGNGVLAVTALGLFFGNVYLKKKRILMTFGALFSNLFEILVFLLLGLSLTLPTSYSFYLQSIFLFVIYVCVRTLVIFLIPTNKFSSKEKLFVSLNSPKGVAVAVVSFTFLSLGLSVESIVQLTLLFIIYSIILSTTTSRFSKYFLGIKPELVKEK